MAMIKPNRIYESNRAPRSFVLKLNPLISVHFIVYQRTGNRWRQTEQAGVVSSQGVYSESHQSAPVVPPTSHSPEPQADLLAEKESDPSISIIHGFLRSIRWLYLLFWNWNVYAAQHPSAERQQWRIDAYLWHFNNPFSVGVFNIKRTS